MKKLFMSLLCLGMIFGATGCTSGGDCTYEIAMITDTGSVTDKSFNQTAYDGVKEFGDNNNITYKYYVPKDTDQAGLVSTIDDAVDNGAKVIVTPGFAFAGAVYQAQEKYPDVKFITIDFEPQKDGSGEIKVADNTVSYMFSEQESGYLAGYAAVKEGYTQLGYMGGQALPAVENFGVGYAQGASDAAKEMNVKVKLNYTYTGTFAESPDVKSKASSWYAGGTEVIFSCGGQICNSIFAAAQEANKYSIGVDTDQSGDSTSVITSALKDVKGATMEALKAYKDDKFQSGKTITLKNSGEIVYPGSFKNFKQADYDAVNKKIKEGSLNLKSYNDVDEKTGDPSAISFDNLTINFE